MSAASPWERLVPHIAFLVVVTGGLLAWDFTVDDAYVTARYAARIARGLGYTYNDGVTSDGVTGPLWLLPALLGELVGLPGLLLPKAVGLLATGLSVHLAVRHGLVQGRAQGGLVALLAGLQPDLALWGVAGLETGVSTLLFTWIALTDPKTRRAAVVVAGGAGALAWLRPELLAGAAILVASGAVGAGRKRAWLGPLIFGLGLLSVAAFRAAQFDSVLPLSFFAKGASPVSGLRYLGWSLWLLAPMLALAAIGTRAHPRGPPLGLAVIAHLLAVAAVGGDWMPGFRLLVPVMPLLAVLAASGGLRLWSSRRPARVLTVSLVALGAALPTMGYVVQLPEAREAGALRRRLAAPLASELASRGRSFGAVDIGYLGFESGLRVLDLGGLVDPAVARSPGGHLAKRIDVGHLARHAPDMFVLHSSTPPRADESGTLTHLAGHPVERDLARSAWFQRHYVLAKVVPYAPAYYYALCVQRGEGVTPGDAP